jgi:hypothetical protein
VSKQFMVLLGVGVAIVAAGLGVMLIGTKGAHLDLDGKILKVRVLPLSDRASLVVVDFRVSNPADLPFVVKSASIILDTGAGEVPEGRPISKDDLDNVFKYEKLLGPAFNDALIVRDKIAPKATIDRMTAARFEISEAAIAARKSLKLRIDELDGAFAEFTEGAGKSK